MNIVLHKTALILHYQPAHGCITLFGPQIVNLKSSLSSCSLLVGFWKFSQSLMGYQNSGKISFILSSLLAKFMLNHEALGKKMQKIESTLYCGCLIEDKYVFVIKKITYIFWTIRHIKRNKIVR